MYGKPIMTCFEYQIYLYCYHHYLNFECYTVNVFRGGGTMSHQTAPTHHRRQSSPPPFVW
jgi:hypothetical protein